MRFISAQLEALLTNDLWLKSAQHANRRARQLEKAIRDISGIKIVYPVEANGVFAAIPRGSITKIQKRYFFYVWNEEESVARWMCSFDTTEDDIKTFAKFVREAVRTS
jgi:threonine aldolase